MFFSSANYLHTGCGTRAGSYLTNTFVFFQRDKPAGCEELWECEFNHSSLYSVDVRNDWSYTYAPTTPLWSGQKQIYPNSICALLIIWKLSRSSVWNAPFKQFFPTIAKQKHLLISSCHFPVCPHISLRFLSDGFVRNLMKLGTPTIICRETPNLAKMGQEYRSLYIKTYVSFTVARDLIRHNRIVAQSSLFLYHWCWRVLQQRLLKRTSMFRFTHVA
jgi:hypothetical protein